MTLTGAVDPADVAADLWNNRRSAIVLTDGTRGSHAFTSPSQRVYVAAFPISAVDTTGCGDAFHGAYAWSLMSGAGIIQRVTMASAAAAVVAALPAGARRAPTREAIADLAVG